MMTRFEFLRALAAGTGILKAGTIKEGYSTLIQPADIAVGDDLLGVFGHSGIESVVRRVLHESQLRGEWGAVRASVLQDEPLLGAGLMSAGAQHFAGAGWGKVDHNLQLLHPTRELVWRLVQRRPSETGARKLKELCDSKELEFQPLVIGPNSVQWIAQVPADKFFVGSFVASERHPLYHTWP